MPATRIGARRFSRAETNHMTIELTTAALFLFSAFYGAPAAEFAPLELLPLEQEMRLAAKAIQPVTLEQYVREYFKEVPLMAEIARCESRFRHLDERGKVLRGELSEEDVGVMQINEFYHEDTAKVLGLNLHTLDGNLAYARWLYSKEGFTPWYSSSKCWQRSQELAKAGTTAQLN